MSKFVDCERNQAFLLPPDLRDWIPEDDLAHFVIEAVERVEMSAFKVNHRGTGSAQYHPRMMLALLIYCYANGIFSSRLERATHRDIGVRFVAANVHPDHDTIATFRRDNLAAFGESFLQVLLLAKELKPRRACQRRRQQVREQAPFGDMIGRRADRSAQASDGACRGGREGEDAGAAQGDRTQGGLCDRRCGASAPRGSGQGARRSGRTTRPRWRRARRAPAGPRASTRSRPTRRRAPTSRAI